MAPADEVDVTTFSRRLKHLYDQWLQNKKQWGCDIFVVATPPSDNSLRFKKSLTFSRWLFGDEFTECVILFTKDQIHFVCSQAVASTIQLFKESAEVAASLEFVVHVTRNRENGLREMDRIVKHINSVSSRLGCIIKETYEEKPAFIRIFYNKLLSSGLEVRDITIELLDLFAVTDELNNMRLSGKLNASALNCIVEPKVRAVIREGILVTDKLTQDTDEALLNPKDLLLDLDDNYITLQRRPKFRSYGNSYGSDGRKVDGNVLHYGRGAVIVCEIGSSYKGYSTNVVRTFLGHPERSQRLAYQVLLKAHEAAVRALKPGYKASDVYKIAFAFVEAEAKDLVKNLTKTAGTGIGVEYCELGLKLTMNNDRILKQGMVFNVALEMKALKTSSKIEYDMKIADTVLITANGQEVLTDLITKNCLRIEYNFETMVGKPEPPAKRRKM